MTVGKLRLKRNRHVLLWSTLLALLSLVSLSAAAQNSVDAMIPTELMDQWPGCIDAIEADVGVEIILQEVSMRDVWTRIDTQIRAGVPPTFAILTRAELERKIQPQEDDPRSPEELLEGMGILPLNDRLDPFDILQPYEVGEMVAGVLLDDEWVTVFFDGNTVDVGLEILRHACLQGEAEPDAQVTVDLDVPTLPAVTAGSTLTGRFAITNTGNVLLRGLSLTDSVFGEVPLSTTFLNPGASTYGWKPYALEQADVATGSIRTVATVRAAAPYGLSLESEHELLVNLSTSPALRVEIVPLVLAYSLGEHRCRGQHRWGRRGCRVDACSRGVHVRGDGACHHSKRRRPWGDCDFRCCYRNGTGSIARGSRRSVLGRLRTEPGDRGRDGGHRGAVR